VLGYAGTVNLRKEVMELTASQKVIREAFPNDEELWGIAAQEMTYIMNCTGGRPSDNACTAVRYVKFALRDTHADRLASPSAQARMQRYLIDNFGPRFMGVQS
jgi:hypothetical protein